MTYDRVARFIFFSLKHAEDFFESFDAVGGAVVGGGLGVVLDFLLGDLPGWVEEFAEASRVRICSSEEQ